MKIETLGVVRAGTMGSGIARTAAIAGLEVVVVNMTIAALVIRFTAVAASLERACCKNNLEATTCDAALARIQTLTDYRRLAATDFVIEAATDHLDLKVRILKQIESVLRQDAIIAWSTSSISITALGMTLDDSSRVIGCISSIRCH
ncbi:3-hydroxyacyl-CoA dehydrogenase NAD-binding domain-containing protein [Caballeronia udeis]|uniref:3-hydroxyacyl-CoA dehydrogenase NAD-binding domain-containing protein n=1 Tax=Caballeronia udeis TaxID=1232866 RepID=UPI003850FD6A